MNTEVIKNFTLTVKIYEGNEIEDISKEYIFTCRNCLTEFPMQINNYDDVEFNLSLHLMNCPEYSRKLENTLTKRKIRNDWLSERKLYLKDFKG